MTALIIALVLAGCTGDARPEAEALEAYERGREQLERGEHAAAAESFGQAAEHDPRRTVLRSWQAYALAEGGDPAAAIQLLEGSAVVGLGPHDRYNLAAWHERLGQREQAQTLLAAALGDDPALRERLVEDPDFAALLEDGSLAASLTDSELRAVMLGEEGAILAGELYDLELNVQPGAVGLSLGWDSPVPDGLVLERVIDERSGEPGAAGLRLLQYRLRSSGAGEGSLGPWTVSLGEHSVAVPPVDWQAVVPAGVSLESVEAPPALAPSWWTPREALKGLEAGQAEHRDGLLVVCHLPGDRIEVQADAVEAEPLELELRRDDQPELLARAWRWAEGATAAQVTITRKGSVVLDSRVER